MKLLVPTNWDDTLIEQLKDCPIEEFYGKLQMDCVGGGRPAISLPLVRKRRVKQHVRLIRNRGYAFNYLLNASCLGNHEFTRAGQQRMRRFLGWLSECGVERVTLSSPYLAMWVKENFPSLEITASILAHVDTLNKFLFWKEMGAKRIVLSYDCNRNFSLLRRIQQAGHNCAIALLVNVACLKECPFIFHHRNSNAHASLTGDRLRGFGLIITSCGVRIGGWPIRFVFSRPPGFVPKISNAMKIWVSIIIRLPDGPFLPKRYCVW